MPPLPVNVPRIYEQGAELLLMYRVGRAHLMQSTLKVPLALAAATSTLPPAFSQLLLVNSRRGVLLAVIHRKAPHNAYT